MTVGVVLGKSVATGTGSVAAFSFNAPVAAVDELAVYTVVIATGVQTKQTRGGSGTYDFSVTINASTRFATVTLNNNLPDTHQVIILREVAIKQETDYVAGDAFPAETHEAALDKLTFITTQLSERIDRTVKFQEALASDLPGDITASSTLRANKAIKFASDGSIGLSTNDPDEQVTLATTQATNAATSATAASTSATAAATSATAAASSATAAASSATAAASSATSADAASLTNSIVFAIALG
tara:strand:+ start:286 stop:1017 length:732 start_codon:yes stop_codon:yes gene_type:complete